MSTFIADLQSLFPKDLAYPMSEQALRVAGRFYSYAVEVCSQEGFPFSAIRIHLSPAGYSLPEKQAQKELARYKGKPMESRILGDRYVFALGRWKEANNLIRCESLVFDGKTWGTQVEIRALQGREVFPASGELYLALEEKPHRRYQVRKLRGKDCYCLDLGWYFARNRDKQVGLYKAPWSDKKTSWTSEDA